jgi:pyruvate dehydrogenase E1 component beta subunit
VSVTEVTYREAMRKAIGNAMRVDERVMLIGEDVGRYGGSFAVSLGLLEEFGPERVRDAPLSESAFVGAGIGAAMAGMRPIVEIMTVNFALLALDQIMNNAATLRHMSAGQIAVPLVIRMTTGGGRQLAAQHSHSLEGLFAHIPGLRVLAPATVTDLEGGDAVANAAILTGILDGSVTGPKRDLVTLNAAAGLVITGIAQDLPDGLRLANEAIDSRAALAVLERWRNFV